MIGPGELKLLSVRSKLSTVLHFSMILASRCTWKSSNLMTVPHFLMIPTSRCTSRFSNLTFFNDFDVQVHFQVHVEVQVHIQVQFCTCLRRSPSPGAHAGQLLHVFYDVDHVQVQLEFSNSTTFLHLSMISTSRCTSKSTSKSTSRSNLAYYQVFCVLVHIRFHFCACFITLIMSRPTSKSASTKVLYCFQRPGPHPGARRRPGSRTGRL